MRSALLNRLAAVAGSVHAFVCFGAASHAISLAPGDIVVVDVSADAIVAIDPSSGERTIVSSSTIGSGPSLFGVGKIAVAPGGAIYVRKADGVLAVDPLTGDRTVVTGLGVGSGPAMTSPSAVAVESAATLLVSDVANTANAIFRVHIPTGNRIILTDESGTGSGPVLSTPVGIALEASGDVVTANLGFGGVIRVSAASGDRAIVSDTGGPGSGPDFFNLNGIAVEASGSLLVITGNNTALFRVDPVTGDRTVLSSESVGSGPLLLNIRGVGVGLDGIVYASSSGAVYAVDPVTGDRVVLSGQGIGDGPEFAEPRYLAIVPIPEPSTAALLAVGLIGVSWSRRGRRPTTHTMWMRGSRARPSRLWASGPSLPWIA